MIYAIIRFLLQGAIRIFFRSITISNRSVIPEKGPVIFLANHPATFMDPIVIACLLKRQVYFLAKAELFRGGFANWILDKMNIVPVYRKQDDPTKTSRNSDTFKKCFEHLEKGGALLIFPEGVSITTERKLKPIKPGAAVIAFGAEARNDFKLNVKIVNMGLNYADQHHFNQDLFINVHEPIMVKDYESAYTKDRSVAINQLVSDMQHQIESLIISIEDKKTDAFVRDIETLYLHKLASSNHDFREEFAISQNIVKAVRYFSETNPLLVKQMKVRIKNYLRHLKVFHLHDEDLDAPGSSFFNNLKETFFLISGLPIYLYGLLNNYLPFEIPGWLAKSLVTDKDYKAATAMVLGIFTFPLFYFVQILLFQHYFRLPLITVIYAGSLPFTGIFAHYYWNTFTHIRTKWILIALFYKRKRAIELLIEERNSILHKFETAREEFLDHFPDIRES